MADSETPILRLVCPSPRPFSGRMRLMTYNVWDGPRHFAAVCDVIRRHDPDIVALQEVTEDGAQGLASELGYEGIFFAQSKDLRQGKRYINGKAILSRYPIKTAYHHCFELSPDLRGAACERRGDYGELNEDRGVLGAEIQWGSRCLDILCTHLALGDAQVNAANLMQLHAFLHQLRVQGFELLLMGDFNCHFGIRREADYRPYLEAYGKSPGNIAHPYVLEVSNGLQAEFKNAWEVAIARKILLPEGQSIPPEDVPALQGEVPTGSTRWIQLQDALDGNTHLQAHKRFDNILVGTGIEVVSVLIDQCSQASDHCPVVADLSWSRHVPTQEKAKEAS